MSAEEHPLVAVRTFTNRQEAEVAQGALESAGLESLIAADDAGATQPGLWMSGVRLLVREEDLEEATGILGDE